jgi:SAM-dependent methyltransferase
MRRALRRVLGHSRGSEQGRSFYDDRYARKAAYQVPYHLSPYYPVWTVIADRVRDSRAVLEVGCGAGQLAALLLDGGLPSYTGFDLSPVAIELARKNAPKALVHVADAFETDLFATSTFDTLICTEVLEHLNDDHGLIRRWPAGVRCLCTVPDFDATAHVRYFPDGPDQVRERYASFFDHFTIVTIKRPHVRGGRFFLLDGYRLGG